jgi:hypothetical protein
MFNEAKKLAAQIDNFNIRELIMRQIRSSEEDGDWRSASEMYVVAGEYLKAIQIMESNNWFDQMMELCNKLHKMYCTFLPIACAVLAEEAAGG